MAFSRPCGRRSCIETETVSGRAADWLCILERSVFRPVADIRSADTPGPLPVRLTINPASHGTSVPPALTWRHGRPRQSSPIKLKKSAGLGRPGSRFEAIRDAFGGLHGCRVVRKKTGLGLFAARIALSGVRLPRLPAQLWPWVHLSFPT